jgi:hypothetical protein
VVEYGRVVSARVLIVVPTLGRRLRLLEQTLESITSQRVAADVVIVGPPDQRGIRDLAERFEAILMADPGSQPAAINAGVSIAQPHHEFVNWLGDDDLLTPGSLRDTTQVLDAHPDAVLAYGACQYISEDGALLWTNKAGSWAPRMLSWGPDLIPQPGMLIRTSAWHAVGGVDESLRFAFDLDLLLSLRSQGDLVCTGSTVSCFRWHPDSLTVSDRTTSLNESRDVKRRYLSPRARRWAWTWEGPVRLATRVAARGVVTRAQRASAPKTAG